MAIKEKFLERIAITYPESVDTINYLIEEGVIRDFEMTKYMVRADWKDIYNSPSKVMGGYKKKMDIYWELADKYCKSSETIIQYILKK